MNREKLVQFLLSHFGIQTLQQLDPWANVANGVRGWELLTPKTEQAVDFPRRDAPNDCLVIMQRILVRHVESHEEGFMLRLNYTHQSVAKEAEQRKKVLRDGGLQEIVFPVPPRFNDTVRVDAIPYTSDSFHLCDAFTKTMALINSQNIMNGIIRLTPEQCAEFGLPKTYVFGNPPEQYEADFYVMIPKRHIWSWLYYNKLKNGVMAIDFDHYYFIAPNKSLEATIKVYNELFVGRTDIRPLQSIGFEPFPVQANVIATLHYHILPNPNDYDAAGILPILHNDFIIK
jgi:hypothetical protein